MIRVESLVGNDLQNNERSGNIHLMEIMTRIDFEKELMLSACGGLLGYLMKTRIINQLEDPSDPIFIRDISSYQMTSFVRYNSHLIRNLSICSKEVHPSGTGPQKEGLSLFNIMKFTRTSPGTRLLRSWVLAPLKDPVTIEDRLQQISILLNPSNEQLFSDLCIHLHEIKDVNRIISKIYNISAKFTDWKSLSDVNLLYESRTYNWIVPAKFMHDKGTGIAVIK
jgi:DNA mismatch repair ATPase MutS